MTKAKIKQMILDILTTADYDLGKSFDPKSSDEPELIEEAMSELISIVSLYLNEDDRKKK